MIRYGTKCILVMSLSVFTFVGLPLVDAQSGGASGEKIVLKEGSDVRLKFAQDLSSKTASEGDSVNFVLAEDLTVGNVIVARAGAKAVGSVTNAKKAGMMGKGGELNVRLNI